MAWQGTAMGLPRPANYMHPIQVLFWTIASHAEDLPPSKTNKNAEAWRLA
jgi:hypothetical protein